MIIGDMTRVICSEVFVNGKSTGFVWHEAESADRPDQAKMKELHANGLLHGPFATKSEAKRDAEQTLPEGRWVTMN